MAVLSVVTTSNECEARLRAFVRQPGGKIDSVLVFPSGTQYDVAIAEDRLKLLTAWLEIAGGFRFRRP